MLRPLEMAVTSRGLKTVVKASLLIDEMTHDRMPATSAGAHKRLNRPGRELEPPPSPDPLLIFIGLNAGDVRIARPRL